MALTFTPLASLLVCLFVERVPAGIEAWQREGVTLGWVFSCPGVMANI